MTDKNDAENQHIGQPETRLEDLRNQCTLRGIKFHHRNNEEKLLELIAQQDAKDNPVPTKSPGNMTSLEKLHAMRRKCLRLRRVMITCNDPMKLKYKGEIFQAANANVAAIRKYCPFGNTNGWYMPQLLLNVAEEKQFRRPNSDERNALSGGMAKMYNITYLDDLTVEQFNELKHQQELRKAQLAG